MAVHKGIGIHQYLDDWLVRATSHQVCLQHTQDLVKICQELGWLVNLENRNWNQAGLRPCRLPVQPHGRSGLTYMGPLTEPSGQILEILSLPACPVQQFMSLIGLPTATRTEVHLGRLHRRPIQWHLKNNWRVPESLEKVIPITRSLHPHLQWWPREDNVRTGQPLHPIKHALQIFTDASKEGWGLTMENLDLVHQKSSNSQSPTYSRPAKCGSRQAIQARPDHPNRVVSPSGCLPSNMQQVAPA